MRRLAVYVFLLSLLALAGGGPAGALAIIAHRGLHVEGAPENSLPAVAAAIALGADYVELDIRTTADGLLVDHHDAELPGLGQIAELPYSRVQTLDLVSLHDEAWLHAPVPLVAQELALGKGRIKFYLDMKAVAPERVVWLLQQLDMVDEAVCYQGPEVLRQMRQLEPAAQIMPHMGDEANMARLAGDLRPAYVESGWQGAPELAGIAHRYGAKLFLDIADNQATYVRRCLRAGVDGVQTDQPRLVREIVQRAGGQVRAPGKLPVPLPKPAPRHRGQVAASLTTPPLAAVREAVGLGADYLVLPVYTSRDGKLVVSKDEQVPSTRGRRKIADCAYREMRGSGAEPAVPLLAEVLGYAERRCGLILDLRHADPAQAWRLVVEFDLAGQAMLRGNEAACRAVRERYPNARLLVTGAADRPERVAAAWPGSYLELPAGRATPGLARLVRSAGLRPAAWVEAPEVPGLAAESTLLLARRPGKVLEALTEGVAAPASWQRGSRGD